MLDSAPRYRLEDRYTLTEGRVLLNGTQALVRVLLDQARRDARAGLATAGFVSGYRGSPLGGVDQALWQAQAMLEAHRIEFLPAVNEDLAATAVLGSQQVETSADRQYDGVFGLWYGKGPGVDRAGDALKHGNAYGSSPHGGVLVVAGDDHGCVSSSMPHQSDVAFMSWFMPTLNPATLEEYLSFGAYGYALSRFSGMWVGFKAISETVESSASVELPPERTFAAPHFEVPAEGLHYRWPDLPGPQIEQRMEAKKHAVYAFARANPIDRRIYDIAEATYGIVTTGKAHLDLMEALRLLGLDEAACRRLGIDIYKVGMVWPLPRHDALAFVRGKQEILVIEEKRGIIESQFKEYFYDDPGNKPERMVGKHDDRGERLVPWTGELSPRQLAPLVARRLEVVFAHLDFSTRLARIKPREDRLISITGATRTPYFCSGCPHNTSTRVPDGSRALAGIGCHFMASWMNRETTSLIQMGGEGVNWAASSRFTGNPHIFQNLGEGTYYHSGSMAIRQSVAAGANITYKILFNDAVAMTGGQPVDGPLSVHAIAHALRAEGVTRIAVVSDRPRQLRARDFPANVTIHHRREIDEVQRELREIPGVSVLIYQQMCATEKRRRRKRGELTDATARPVINELVCEGCGDCSSTSNCLSVEPVETPLGRKRRINPSTCNQDLTCVDGFCPSFVTVRGTRKKRPPGVNFDINRLAAALPMPANTPLDRPYDLLITGVGGTGVLTAAALVTMAAHLDQTGVSVLDFTGFAQKFGPVVSFIRFARTPAEINQVRIDAGAADGLIACDLVVATSPKASSTYRRGMRAAVNTACMPTGDVVRERDADLSIATRLEAIRNFSGAHNVADTNANELAEKLLGDSVFANVIMLGFAWQLGLVPVKLSSLHRAIELNGVAPEENARAFALGRIVAADPAVLAGSVNRPDSPTPPPDEVIAVREQFLRDYQNDDYASQYRERVDRVRLAEQAFGSDALTRAAAQSIFHLMAIKDEYEVARLYTQGDFDQRLNDEFEPGYKVRYHFAPPFLPTARDARGRPRKIDFGGWVAAPLRVLARLRFLRGTPFDPFGYSNERRRERELIAWFDELLDALLRGLRAERLDEAAAIARSPLDIRGYGPVRMAAIDKVESSVAAAMRSFERDDAGANAALDRRPFPIAVTLTPRPPPRPRDSNGAAR